MIKYFLIIALLATSHVFAQELFVYTEPASNMPTKTIGLRTSQSFFKDAFNGTTSYHILPEVMFGISKNLMVHAEAFISNRNKALSYEGVGLYAKYRFYNKDDIHTHFRMAAFGRLSTNNSDIHQEELDINAQNSGYQLGFVATQLLHKVALSSSVSYMQAFNNGGANKFPSNQANQAINYTLSFGKLLLPKVYINYNQTNLNIMVEALGQQLVGNAKGYLDIAPSLQLIIHSQTRIDIGYRHQIYSNALRSQPIGFVLRVEHLLFNAL
jgi:hypothetical protein